MIVLNNDPTAISFVWTVSVNKLRISSHLTQKFTAKLNSVVAVNGATPTYS